jgi:hypothetical protein
MIIPFPVRAVRDLRPNASLLIERGTPGEITGMTKSHYTVTFWPFGIEGATVTLNYLTKTDLLEA